MKKKQSKKKYSMKSRFFPLKAVSLQRNSQKVKNKEPIVAYISIRKHE